MSFTEYASKEVGDKRIDMVHQTREGEIKYERSDEGNYFSFIPDPDDLYKKKYPQHLPVAALIGLTGK